MRSAFLRLLAFVAVLLMPFGMSVASAVPIQEHQVAMPMQHCPQPDSTHHSSGALADCTMACASALPAAELSPVEAPPVIRAPVGGSFIPTLFGIELEIATPPPRLS